MIYTSMGMKSSDAGWSGQARSALQTRLGIDAAVFVVDDPDHPGQLASCAAATLSRRLPSPANPSGLVGYVQWVGTVPEQRRRGYSRSALTALIGWLRDADSAVVELHATPEGLRLYQELGFAPARNPCLRRTVSWTDVATGC